MSREVMRAGPHWFHGAWVEGGLIYGNGVINDKGQLGAFLVATRALPTGTILDPTAIKFIPWPKDLVEGAYFKHEGTDIKSLQGTVVRFAIPAGQVVTLLPGTIVMKYSSRIAL